MFRILIILTAIAELTNLVYASAPIVLYIGATKEENRQLSGLDTAKREGQLVELKYLNRILEEHPDNAPARSFRANALMNIGRLDEAWKDISELARRKPDYWMLTDCRISYYYVKGDRIKEIEEIHNLMDKYLTYDITQPDSELQIRWATKSDAEASFHSKKARIAELSGDIELAKKAWQDYVDKARPQSRAYNMIEQSQFLLRQGDIKDAVKTLNAALKIARSTIREDTKPMSAEDYDFTKALVWHGLALWADGKRAEALPEFLEVAERPIKIESYGSGHIVSFDRNVTVLSANILASSGNEKDKSRAAKVMDDLSKYATDKRPYSMEPVVAALSGKTDMKPVVKTISTVLKQAPYLDWALWGALYLGLSDKEEAKPLLQMLPNGTIQRQIADQEGKNRKAGK